MSIQLYEDQPIRTAWDEENEEWYFSIVDVVCVLTEQLLRIIQSIPSKKAEPFKLWLAQVGRERIEEIIDPELTIDRALETYSKKGYPADWINQRLQTIHSRKELTDEWQTLSG